MGTNRLKCPSSEVIYFTTIDFVNVLASHEASMNTAMKAQIIKNLTDLYLDLPGFWGFGVLGFWV